MTTKKNNSKISRDLKLMYGSTLFSIIVTVLTYGFSLFPPNTNILIRLIPVYVILIGPFIVLLRLSILRIEKNELLKSFLSMYKKRIITISIISFLLIISVLIKVLTQTDIIDNDLIDHYVKYEKNYWEEITQQLKKQYATKKNLFPDFYKNAGNQLIFPAIDGLVSVCFAKDFKFKEKEYNDWLSQSEDLSEPKVSVVETNISNQLTISNWTQIFSGNGIKISRDNEVPNDIFVRGLFPEIPPMKIYDPRTDTYYPYTLFTIEVNSDSIEYLGLSLRNVKLQEVESGKFIIPFLWRQLDIYGKSAIRNLDIKEAKLKASRELSSILAGLNLGLPRESFLSNPINPVLEKFELLLRDYNKLLSIDYMADDRLKEFIRKFPILIEPSYLNVIPDINLGHEHIIDLIIEKISPNGPTPMLVKFGSSVDKLFLNNDQLSEELNKYLKEISEWRQLLRSDAKSISESLGIMNLDADTPAVIIIGRKKTLSKNNLDDLAAMSKDLNYKTKFITYDDILEKSISWLNNIRGVKKYFGMK